MDAVDIQSRVEGIKPHFQHRPAKCHTISAVPQGHIRDTHVMPIIYLLIGLDLLASLEKNEKLYSSPLKFI